MKSIRASVTILALFSSLSAHAEAPVPACVFENVVAFGASVTQATPAMVPGYRAIVKGVETYGNTFGDSNLPPAAGPLQDYTPRPYGLSPVRYLMKRMAGKEAADRVTYTGRYITRNEKDLGSSQILEMLQGSQRETFDRATLLAGVDAFYWDAIFENCGYGRPSGAEPVIRLLIEAAKQRGITLILGTVPFENSTNVRIASERTGVGGLWWAPDVRCAESINSTLKTYCTPENGCYITDLKGIVDDLSCGEKLPVSGGGRYSYFELRPDGVHLSDKGSRLVADRMVQALKANPPSCRK